MSSENSEQQRARPVEREVDGYPQEARHVGGPTDVDSDLARAFPKPDSLLGGILPEAYFDWKEDLYAKAGVKLAVSYQALFQQASDTRSTGLLGANTTDWAAGGWLLIEGKWEAYNRGEDYQGGVTAAFDWRHGFGSAAEGASFFADTGSLWPTDFAQVQWDPWFPVLYWEQWGTKDRFVFRLGNQLAPQIFDFFRFKDSRSSFTSAPLTAPATSLPFPPPGLGASFELWPVKDSQLYVIGTVNDMNAEVEEISWDNATQYWQFFYGVEVGYNWIRGPGDLDHIHLDVFYADERDTASPFFPNDAGWGLKVAGSKQWDRIVGFANYTYNTAEGGGFGLTFADHSVNAGVAYVKPLGVAGEVAVGGSWAHPIQSFDNPAAGPIFGNLRDQYGVESYWKILLTPDLWVTPGVQVIFDPSFNPDDDTIVIGQLKFRLFF